MRSSGMRAPANPAASAGPRLVGRARELAALDRSFELAAAGRAAVVLVAGEPGIGKTRLLEAFAARAARAGATLLRGGASDAAGMPPYLPFLEALQRHVESAAPDLLRAQAGPLAPILATILPELVARLGELPSSYPLPAEQARLRLYEAVGSLLAAVAVEEPLVLLLDDLHWSDPASLELLCHVVRQQPRSRLLIVGAYRGGEAEQRPEFARAVAELNRLRALETVGVGPLPADELAALAQAYLNGPLHPATGRLLFEHSEPLRV